MTSGALGLGLGWRPELAGLALARRDLGFVEVIAESVPERGPLVAGLEALLARGTTVVPHGIRLSLGGAEPLDRTRLAALARAATRVRAPIVSEHAAFVRAGALEAGHLLPVPLTRSALRVMAENVHVAMSELPVPLAIENGASTFRWPDAELDESAFLCELVDRTGCLLLLDLANLHVNGANHGFDPVAALERLPLERIAYVHTAGGVVRDGLLHDTHAHALWPEVVVLLEELTSRVSVPGVLLERDDRFPPRSELSRELDVLVRAWHAGDESRRALEHAARRRPTAIDQPWTAPERDTLAVAQTAVVATLVAGSADPPGFSPERLAAARDALRRKRAREARASWPALASHLGTGFGSRFERWASARPGTLGGAADAVAFADALPARERRRMPRRLTEDHVRRRLAIRGDLDRRARSMTFMVTRGPAGFVVGWLTKSGDVAVRSLGRVPVAVPHSPRRVRTRRGRPGPRVARGGGRARLRSAR